MARSQDPSPSAASTPAPDAVVATTAAAPTAAPVAAVNRKRKRAPPAPRQQQQQQQQQQSDAASPAPDAQGTPAAEPISKSRFDPSKPIPTHSAAPGWVAAAGLNEFFHTEGISHNRNRYRYTDAVEVAAYVFHSQESLPATVRVCWEDCSALLAVTQDGLGVAGDKGYRSARLNVPVREGRWYLEFAVELGGGTDRAELGRAEGSHVRVGWARREAPLNGPVGLDGYSYGVCDRTGDKVTLSRRKPYGRPFGSGDVVGLYISLPPLRTADPADPHDPALLRRKRQPVGIKGRTYFEQVEYAPSKEMDALKERGADATVAKRGPQARPHGAGEDGQDAPPPPPVRARPVKNLPGSNPRSKAPPPEPSGRTLPTLGRDARIAFFVNGECQGTAFEDIFDFRQLRLTAAQRKAKEKEKKGSLQERANPFDDGTLGYYPFLSLFNHGRVRINPGPDFAFPPPPDVDALLDGVQVEDVKRTWRPLCERYAEHWAEIRALDALEDDHQHELARQLMETDEKRKVEDDRRNAQKETRRIKDHARRLQQKARGGSKLAGSIPPDDERPNATVPSQLKMVVDTPTPVPDREPLPSLPTPPVVTPDAVAQEASKSKPRHVKREPATPQVQPQTFQFAPPYVYPGAATSSARPGPATSPTAPALLSAFDSPPRQQPPPLQRTAFDPIRSAASENQLQQSQHHHAPSHPHAYANSLGLSSHQPPDQRLVVDTSPVGFHPQWNDQLPGSAGRMERERERDFEGVQPMSGGSRPMTSTSPTFRYNTGPGMAGGYAPAQQQPSYAHNTSPPQRPVYRPLSPADLRDGPPPLSPSASRAYQTGSPVAYTLQQESSLRSGADDDAVGRRVGYGLWDPFQNMDAEMRDDDR